MKTAAIALAAIGLTAGTAAWAQASAPAAPQTREAITERADRQFARIDANSDGRIDAADRAARQARAFDRLDSDKNGSISRTEWAAATTGRTARKSERAADRRRAAAGRLERVLGRIDANKDRAVTQAEFRAAALARFERADANRDGRVTQAERGSARAVR